MCEDVRRVKKKKKNGNPLSRSNFQSKSVAFNIDESHPSSFNPHASVSKQPSPQPLCVSLDPFTLTYPQKKRQHEKRTRLEQRARSRVGSEQRRNWSRSRSRWRNRETDYQRFVYQHLYTRKN